MEDKVGFPTLLVGAAVLTILIILSFLTTVNPDPKEPPFIPQKIPYLGHMLGIVSKGPKYYEQISDGSAKYPLPIYSLKMPKGRIYVVNSPELVIAVQRNAKTIMSAPLLFRHSAQIFDLDKETEAICLQNIDGTEGDWGFNHEAAREAQNALALGKPSLDQMNQALLQNMIVSLDKLWLGPTGTDIDLLKWVRNELTMAATNTIYGPMNPLKEQEIQGGFWDFYGDFSMLLLNIVPWLTAPKGYKGRQKVFNALEHYFCTNDHEKNSSGLVKAQNNACRQHNVSAEGIAHLNIGNIIAITANTIPTTFWTLYHIYSSPVLLANIRTEIMKAFTTIIAPNGTLLHQIDVNALRTTSPLLASVFQEVLRFRSRNVTGRLVTKDTLLSDRYLLKKDSIVHIPSRVIHFDTAVWDSSASKFSPDRFMHPLNKPQPGAFRTFGGGTTLCPGRHFAATSILSVVAMFVLRYDMRPVKGEWVSPTQNNNDLVAAVLPPDQDIQVRVIPRKELWGGPWAFTAIDSKTGSPLSMVE